MKPAEKKTLFERFEGAAAEFEGVECWNARELQDLLGYTKWENFSKVVDKAKEACKNGGRKIWVHFPEVKKGNQAGSDIILTRYACYLIAQNGDSRNKQIAFAKNYFAKFA